MEGIEFSSLDKNISNACLIMSHLACADEPTHSQNLKQLRTFHHLTDDLKIRKSLIKYLQTVIPHLTHPSLPTP